MSWFMDEDFLEQQNEALYWAQCEARGRRDLELKLKGLKEMNTEELLSELVDAVKEVIGQAEHDEPLNVGTLQRLVAIVERVESELEEGGES